MGTRIRRCFCFAFLVSLVSLPGCRRDSPGSESNPGEVVVYTSVDQVYAEEVCLRFAEKTGITVSPVFDTEASKTTGLFRRLVAEKENPRADVFWNGEICRTLQLVSEGLAADLSSQVPKDFPARWVDPNGKWVAFSLRARVIVYNTEQVAAEEAPRTLKELTDEKWRGKVAIANPLFGTTATHMAALRVAMGGDEALQWLRDLKENDCRMVEGNSTVRDIVARGDMPLGLTDTDDVYAGIANGKPIDFVLPDQDGMGTLVIPNSAILIAGGPNPGNARKFLSYLLDPEVEAYLAASRARQLPCRDNVERPDDLAKFAGVKPMDVDYAKVAACIQDAARDAEEILNE